MRKVTKERETPQWLLNAAAWMGEKLWDLSQRVQRWLAGSYFGSVTVPMPVNPPQRKDSVRASRLVHYWDSLNANPAMKKSLDSLGAVRSGFADTVRRLREMANGVIKGVNMTLPLANLQGKKSPADKMAAYKQAEQDSLKRVEQLKQDPYAVVRLRWDSGRRVESGWAADRRADTVMRRLAEMRKLLATSSPQRVDSRRADPAGGATERMERLRALLGNREEGVRERRDPEMEKIDGVLDKLLRLQYGERKEGVGPVGTGPLETAVLEVPRQVVAVTTWGSEDGEPAGFMEIGEGGPVDSVGRDRDTALAAIVSGAQTLVAGSTVALELAQKAVVGGRRVLPGQALYGLASLSGERLMINVSSIRVGQAIVPVALQVYDLDGLAGIRVPGAVVREVAKQLAEEAIGGAQVGAIDASIGGQAANAGLQLARSLASRKVRLVRVWLPAGYRVLLKNIKK